MITDTCAGDIEQSLHAESQAQMEMAKRYRSAFSGVSLGSGDVPPRAFPSEVPSPWTDGSRRTATATRCYLLIITICIAFQMIFLFARTFSLFPQSCGDTGVPGETQSALVSGLIPPRLSRYVPIFFPSYNLQLYEYGRMFLRL